MEFKIEGSLNLADQNQVRAAIAFLTALQANPATETEVKKLNVVAAEVVAPAEKVLTPAEKAAATKKANAAKAAADTKEEVLTPAAEAAEEEAPKEEVTEETAAAVSSDFTKDDCREILGAISLAGFKTEIKALLTSDFGVTSITSLTDDQVDGCYAALKKLAGELKVNLA